LGSFFYFYTMIKVLFVCLGNICRSPLAEGIFSKLITENKLTHFIQCDSAGVASYHVGELADKRTRANAQSHGIDLTHRARAFVRADFLNFDYIIAMDKSNLEHIIKMRPEKTNAKILLMREFDNNQIGSDVPDPYYGNENDFENVFQILTISCNEFLNFTKENLNNNDIIQV